MKPGTYLIPGPTLYKLRESYGKLPRHWTLNRVPNRDLYEVVVLSRWERVVSWVKDWLEKV